MNKEDELLTDDLIVEDSEDTQKDKYLTFQLGDEEYGIEIRHVKEVVGIQKITMLPDMPDFVRGVINLRGQVIPVMDVRTRFHRAPREYDDRTCVVVVNVHNASIGLAVDSVNDVLDISEEHIAPPPKVQREGDGRFLRGLGKVGDYVNILLDVERLLFGDEVEAILESSEIRLCA